MTIQAWALTPLERAALIEEIDEWIEAIAAAPDEGRFPHGELEAFVYSHPFLSTRLEGRDRTQMVTLDALHRFRGWLLSL